MLIIYDRNSQTPLQAHISESIPEKNAFCDRLYTDRQATIEVQMVPMLDEVIFEFVRTQVKILHSTSAVHC
jgi:hypothetical protein